MKEWYGELKPHPRMVSNLLQAAEVSDPARAAELLLGSSTNHAMAQASGMIEYIKKFLHPNMVAPEPAMFERLQRLSRSEDADLRALALTILNLGYDALPEAHSICSESLRTLEPGHPVRRRWAVATSYKADALVSQGDVQQGVLAYQQSLAIDPGNVVILSHLALAWLSSGKVELAIETLKKGLALQPYRAVLHFQLASIYQRQQQIPEALRELQEGLQYAPDNPAANQMLEQLRRQ